MIFLVDYEIYNDVLASNGKKYVDPTIHQHL
jgi:hypothetical protein